MKSKYCNAKNFISIFLSVLIIFVVCVKLLPFAGYRVYMKKIHFKPQKPKSDDAIYQKTWMEVDEITLNSKSDRKEYRKNKQREEKKPKKVKASEDMDYASVMN